MEHSRTFSPWLSSIGRPDAATPEVLDGLQPVIIVDDAKDACQYVDPPVSALYWPFGGFPGLHSGLIIDAGPRGTWVERLVEFEGNTVALACGHADDRRTLDVDFGSLLGYEAQISSRPSLHQASYGCWLFANLPGFANGNGVFALVTSGDFGTPFYLPSGRVLYVYTQLIYKALGVEYLVRDVP